MEFEHSLTNLNQKFKYNLDWRHTFSVASFLTDQKTMAKPTHRSKACERIFDGLQLLCSLLGILVFITFITFSGFITTTYKPTRLTFYDDPKLSYSIGDPVKNWDDKRRNWILAHPRYASQELVLLVTGSQPSVCKNPIGDHLLRMRCLPIWSLRFRWAGTRTTTSWPTVGPIWSTTIRRTRAGPGSIPGCCWSETVNGLWT